jgi:hypothetical protein
VRQNDDARGSCDDGQQPRAEKHPAWSAPPTFVVAGVCWFSTSAADPEGSGPARHSLGRHDGIGRGELVEQAGVRGLRGRSQEAAGGRRREKSHDGVVEATRVEVV